MKIICSKSNLLNGVNTVSKAVPSKTTMSILECILIDATKGEIRLTANDMELGIETIIEGEIAEKGIIALDAKIFLEMVRKLPDNDVTIATDPSYKATITCEKAKFNIVGKSGEDFSYLPQIDRSESICVSQFTLKEVIRQTIFSIADNITNKILTGELFEINEDILKVVSSDGLRISLRRIYLKNSYPARKVIVPGKTMSEISKILPGDQDKDVNIFFTNKHILFEFDSTTVVSRLIEGDYLKIDNILSADYEIAVGLVILYAVTQVVRQVIQPNIVGDSIGMNPLATLIFMYIGYKISSVIGMIIAVPVGMILINLYKAGIFDNQIRCIKELVEDVNRFRKF